ncbi:NF-kappa-B inhibitor-interacting Ras protein 2 [Fasciola gigantica]|uniref:NF-kappa-B inhibitor-interacting Ras protein 2 n=1 Tax=Fasciola gigantica TaxID=46835 RepID=A0A504Z178_FASGI|nr:NF-kappa-B inhibitor-interacting Ras protein 2 [Fasciola gigantica]
MVKVTRLVVCGARGVGKTSIIEQCIYGNLHEKEMNESLPTIEDTYNAIVETDRGTKERVRIYDIGDPAKVERHFINSADAFILVYDLTNAASLSAVQMLKREIDDSRSKREVLFFLFGNKSDKPRDRAIDAAELTRWAHSEKVHHHEISVNDRAKLCNLFAWIVSRVNQSQNKSGFSFGKKEARAFPGPSGPRTDLD